MTLEYQMAIWKSSQKHTKSQKLYTIYIYILLKTSSVNNLKRSWGAKCYIRWYADTQHLNNFNIDIKNESHSIQVFSLWLDSNLWAIFQKQFVPALTVFLFVLFIYFFFWVFVSDSMLTWTLMRMSISFALLTHFNQRPTKLIHTKNSDMMHNPLLQIKRKSAKQLRNLKRRYMYKKIFTYDYYRFISAQIQGIKNISWAIILCLNN